MVSNDDFLAFFQEPPSSPGFEILGERSVGPDPPRRSVAERRPTPYVSEEEHDPSEAPPLPQPLFRNLPHGLASWIVQAGSRITGGNTAGRVERDVPHEGSADRYTYANGVYAPVPQHNPGSGWQIQAQFHLPRLPALDAFQRPRLNYEAQGFELIGAAHASPPPRSSSPYKPPRASAQGFTRKVEEDEIVVCPHCGDELGTGDDDLKQQIWVVKQCGHVSSLCLVLRGIGLMCTGLLRRMCPKSPCWQEQEDGATGRGQAGAFQDLCGGRLQEARHVKGSPFPSLFVIQPRGSKYREWRRFPAIAFAVNDHRSAYHVEYD